MALLHPEIFLKNTSLRLVCQAGRCCEKASASALVSVFSTTDPALAQRINTLFPVFLFDSFAPAHLALRANLRLLYRAPAPVLGCGSKVSLLFVSISVIGG
jgi:hypothetical protein